MAVLHPVKAAATHARSAAWLIRSGGNPSSSGCRILMYHRVADDRDELAVSTRRFRSQMAFLAAHGYHAVGVAEAASLVASGHAQERTIGLSFDDGYRDVVENALPVLEKHGFRATVFLATGVTGGTACFAWYRQQPPVLRWDDVVALDRGGTLEFEAHTITHPNLLELDSEAARFEIAESKSELEERLGRAVTVFSYPAGLFGERERRLVADAGYRFAVSCEPGVNLPTTDPLVLRRRQIDARDGLLDFRAKLAGAHDAPLPLRGLYRRRRYGMAREAPAPASSRR